jgi:hypothetical protein
MQKVYVHETKKTYKMPPHTKHNGLEHFFYSFFFQLLKFNFFILSFDIVLIGIWS